MPVIIPGEPRDIGRLAVAQVVVVGHRPVDLVKRGGEWDAGQEHVQFPWRLLAARLRQHGSSTSLTAILAQPGGTTVPTGLKAVIQTLCLAFDTDPVTEWNFPRHLAHRASLVEGCFP